MGSDSFDQDCETVSAALNELDKLKQAALKSDKQIKNMLEIALMDLMNLWNLCNISSSPPFLLQLQTSSTLT